jgi:hypothetical protein
VYWLCSAWTSFKSTARDVLDALRGCDVDQNHAARPQGVQDPKVPMRRCIYCDRDTDSDFTDEHIWPDGLGGDYLPKDVWRTNDVCGKTNNLCGLYVDGSFSARS